MHVAVSDEPGEQGPPEEGLAGAPPPSPRAAGPRLVIDAARNALVLVGTAQDYERIRPLLQALDKAPRETLIAWLGPAISAKAYEVGDDVRDTAG